MPTYVFRCKDCGREQTAVLQMENRNHAPICGNCDEPMRRIYGGGRVVIRVPNPLTR